MIKKASELLELFIKEETKKLGLVNMPHMPTLGTAYEEITKQGIDQGFSIPMFLNLKVVSGFISAGDQLFSEQIDCMLVSGDGKRYGLTDQYIYNIENVLCIFEVKKTLRKEDLSDAMEHLSSINKQASIYYAQKLDQVTFEPNISSARKIYSQITGKVAPEKYPDVFFLSLKEQILFYTLVKESLIPLTIIQGYDGYKTESGLRKVFFDLLQEKISSGKRNMGVTGFPSLITCNEFCLVKANGMPFVTTIKDEHSWVAIFSTRYNSAKIILELIWSKISKHCNVEMPWNDGLEMDNVNPLLVAEVIEKQNSVGWFYKSLEVKEKLLKRKNDNTWEPVKIGQPEVALVDLMGINGGFLPIDTNLEYFLEEKYQQPMQIIIDKLIMTREFMRDGDSVRPINNLTHLITNLDGSGWVSSEGDRFNLWCTEMQIKPNYLTIVLIEI